ncbi:MAG: alpha-amylase family glycosyl hydrolase [Melioribacteraceae bacterium]
MFKSYYNYLTILSALFIASCNENQEKIVDLIQPIKLTAGKTHSVVISDLFYSKKYDLEFSKNENISVNLTNEKLYLIADPSFEGLTFLEFEVDMNLYQIPIISSKEKFYEFTFKPDKHYQKLTLFGSFNGWDRTNLPMTDANNDGIFSAKVALEPGVYQYKFFGDRVEIEDPENPEKVSNGMGSFNSIRTIEDLNSAKFYLHIDEYYSKNPQSTFSFYLEDDLQGEITTENIFALLDNEKIAESKINFDGKHISINFNYDEIADQTLRIAVSKNGRVSNIQTIKLFNGKPIDNSTFTWNDGIIYSLMIDRFNDAKKQNNDPIEHDSLSEKANYMGGDLQGVIEKLNEGYFDSLGVNLIWLSPVYDNPNEAYKEYPSPHRYYSGYHGYWPIDSYTVDEHLGTLEDVKEIVNIAHKKGIKILLDFVSHHVHIEHPYFKKNKNWFGRLELPDGRLNIRFWDEFRLTTWFEPYLPSFDFLSSNEALEEMTNVAVWWLKETGADGYRHDAVKHVPNEFWRKLNRKINTEISSKRKLPVYQIGETFGSYELISSYVNNGQLNSQFNFSLYDVALPTFIRESSSFNTLDKEMQKTFSVYGENHLMGNIMDSHDKNRFMAFADGDLDASQWMAIEEGWKNPPMVDDPESYKKLILYMAYLNSIPGLPVIYYGSEFGMSGASDPDNRRMMRFGNELSKPEKSTLAEVSKIINLRKTHPALRYGDFYTLQADENVYAFIRSDFNERILVIINKSNFDQNIELNFPKNYYVNNLLNLRTKESLSFSDMEIKINPKSWNMYLLIQK